MNEIEKVHNWPFLVIFKKLLATFLKSQPYDIEAIAHKGLQYGEENLRKFPSNRRTLFEKFEKSPKMAAFRSFLE